MDTQAINQHAKKALKYYADVRAYYKALSFADVVKQAAEDKIPIGCKGKRTSFALHSRRAVESHRHRTQPTTINEAFQEGNPVPRDFMNLELLWEWHSDLIEAEKKLFNK